MTATRFSRKYFDNGFPNATVDVTYVPGSVPDNLPRVGVTFTIHEGEQFFVNQVFLDGLHYTRPGVARREMQVQPGAPLSQQDMLESQRRLYDLGLFKQVDTAIQNPDGTESRKNVLVTTREADRYTFDYGVGFEFQTGQPAVGTNQPLGANRRQPQGFLWRQPHQCRRPPSDPHHEDQRQPPAAARAHQFRRSANC